MVAQYPPALRGPCPKQREPTGHGIPRPMELPGAGTPRMVISCGQHFPNAELEIAHGLLIRIGPQVPCSDRITSASAPLRRNEAHLLVVADHETRNVPPVPGLFLLEHHLPHRRFAVPSFSMTASDDRQAEPQHNYSLHEGTGRGGHTQGQGRLLSGLCSARET